MEKESKEVACPEIWKNAIDEHKKNFQDLTQAPLSPEQMKRIYGTWIKFPEEPTYIGGE